MTDTRYRMLLWLYVAATVASIAASAFPPHSEALEAALEAEPTTWLWRNTAVSIGLFAALAIAWVVGLIGLFRFKGWGRSVSLYSTLAALLAAPLAGSSLYWGLESGLYEASGMLWGAILALAYFSPVSARFGR